MSPSFPDTNMTGMAPAPHGDFPVKVRQQHPKRGHTLLWTPEQEDFLRDNYLTMAYADIGASFTPPRTELAVGIHAFKLGLKKQGPQSAKAIRQAELNRTAKDRRPAKATTPCPEPGAPLPDIVDIGGVGTLMHKAVNKLGLQRLSQMNVGAAQRALRLLHAHQDKFDYVPGASRLFTRLSGHFTLPS